MAEDAARGRPRTLSTRRLYAGKVLSLDIDEVMEPGEIRATREVVRHTGSVAALALADDGRILLVRQYRHPVGEAVWELPAGRLDLQEAPEAGIQRELQEEIGFRATHLEKVAFFYTSPGFSDESMHVFRATGLVPSRLPGDDDEKIEIGAFTLEEARAMIHRGELREGKTLVAVLLEVERRLAGPPGA
jgi:ADP-ribose pyrophosphatase